MSTPSESDRPRCICARCPTYVAGDTGFFCGLGKSKLDIDEKSCLCRTCPVHIEHDLPGREYCVRGLPESA